MAVLAVLALLLAMDTLRVFAGQQWLGAYVRIESQYYYGLLALLLPAVYLLYPTRKMLDVPLGFAVFGILAVLFFSAEKALDEAWEFGAPQWVVYVSFALWLAVIRYYDPAML